VVYGRYKCNVDNDASFVDSESIGWAIVVHNDTGDFVRCISRFMKSKLDLFKTEILATRFQLFSFRCIRRYANKVAHTLTRVALLRVNYMDYTICPFFIVGIVNAKRLANMNDNEGS
ncbi:hypothetical protein Goklo_027137, partial [Gossypium klotzschianum]|nr:hypothetical protein [Gossypium klotzschianum]